MYIRGEKSKPTDRIRRPRAKVRIQRRDRKMEKG